MCLLKIVINNYWRQIIILLRLWQDVAFLQITHSAVTKTTTDSLSFQECKLSIKWEGVEDMLPSDEYYNLFFTGSHQKKTDSFIRLQARSTQGIKMKRLDDMIS